MTLNQSPLEAKRFGVLTCADCLTINDAIQKMVTENISGMVIVVEGNGKQRPRSFLSCADLIYHLTYEI